MVYWDVTLLKIKEHLEYCKCLLTGVRTTGIPPTNCCRLIFLKHHTCLIIASQKPLKILCDLQIKSKCFSLAFRRLLQPPVLVTNLTFSQAKPITTCTDSALHLDEFSPPFWAFPSECSYHPLKFGAHFKSHLPHDHIVKSQFLLLTYPVLLRYVCLRAFSPAGF